MPTRIDHVIAVAGDLPQLEDAFTRAGFAVVGGGTHPHLGTRNRVIVLGEGCIELLAVADAGRASLVVRRRAQRAPGWMGFALQSADLDRDVMEMRSRGVDVRGPVPGRLEQPASGGARQWQVATIGSDDLWHAAEPVPFVIQHATSGETHRRQLAAPLWPLPAHPNGAVALTGVVVAVADLNQAAARYAGVFELAAGAPRQDAALVARTRAIALASGETVTLAQPTGAGVVADRLERADEGVCRVSVRVADSDAADALLTAHDVAHARAADSAVEIAAEALFGATLRLVD